MSKKTNLFQSVYNAVKQIPCGKVCTYGGVAVLAGYPRCARQVGFALHQNPQPIIIPCHRVVFADGSLAPSFAFGGEEEQRRLLEKEGVVFDQSGRVNLKKCLWKGG